VKEVPSHFFVALLGQQEVDGLAVFVHSAIETNPLAPHFDISVVHPPTDPHGALAPVAFLFELWTVFDHSPVNGGVIHVGREKPHNASNGAERVFQHESLWFLLSSQCKNMPHIAGWAAKTLRQAVIT